MRFPSLLATLAFPALAGAALAQQPASPDPKELFAVMSANVMRISPSLEYDRWNANVGLWETRLKHARKPDAATLTAMRESFKTMSDIVDQIRGPEEKGRWDANRALWQAWFDDAGDPSPATKAQMRTTMAALRANLSQITAEGEAARWRANLQLWAGTLAGK